MSGDATATGESEGGGVVVGLGPFSNLIQDFYAISPNDENGLESKAKEIAELITSKQSILVGLVENLGPQLTSPQVPDRVKAVDILARVFSFLPKTFLTEKELEFIVEFLSNRLKDQHLVIPKAILCCYPIVQCQNLPSGAGSRLLHQIFQEANVQSHVHKVRRTVFMIIEFLVRNKLEELKELSSDFVINFLQAMDGEKDPRNLYLLFQIIPPIMSTFDLGPFVEDFFEVMSCYFPIDFAPTVNMGGSLITREMLASALHNCLSHTPKFSPFLIPLTLEKLDSSLVNAKIDSLTLLELCCNKCYQPGQLQPFLPSLWHSLRREIFMGGNEVVERHCMTFLQSVFKVVSQDEEILNICIELIFTECKHHLCEPELRLIHPTSRILLSMCNASEKSASALAPKILLVLNDQLTKTQAIGERKRIMEITELILTSCRQYPQVTLMELVPKWDEMLATWFSFITNEDTEFANLSLKILLQVLGNEADFLAKDRVLLQEHLLALLKFKGGLSGSLLTPGALSTTITIVETLVAKHGEEFMLNSLPKLLEVEPVQEREFDTEVGTFCSKVLAESAPYNSAVMEKVVASLLMRITSLEKSPEALLCLNRIVEKVTEFKNLEEVSTLNSILVKKLEVFRIIFDLAVKEGAPAKVKIQGTGDSLNSRGNGNTFDVSLKILRNLMRTATQSLQQDLVNAFWSQRVVNETCESFFSNFPFQIVEAILGGLRPSVEIHRKMDFTEYLLQTSVNYFVNEADYSALDNSYPYQRLLSAFVNKLDSDEEFAAVLNRVESVIEENLKTICSTEESNLSSPMDVDSESTNNSGTMSSKARSATSLLVWITKGLAMRGVKELNKWLERLIDLLNNDGAEGVGTVAAGGFGILLSDDDISLNPQSYCKFRFLYKQRIFQMSTPKLVLGYRGSKSNIGKANFIKALSSQLKHIPKEILGMEMESVFPLLVASLKLDTSAPLIYSTLKAFTEMLQNSNEATDKKLIEYCYDIIPQLIKLAEFPGNMEVRIMALQCLKKAGRCPIHVILPLRGKVIEDLGKCLDDHKRLVRMEARLARNAWILVGSPGGL